MEDLAPILIEAGLAVLAVVAPLVLARLSQLAASYVGAANAERARVVLEQAIARAIAAHDTDDSRLAYLRNTIPGALKTLKADDAAVKDRLRATAKALGA